MQYTYFCSVQTQKLILIKSMYYEKKDFFLETNTAIIPLLYVFSL